MHSHTHTCSQSLELARARDKNSNLIQFKSFDWEEKKSQFIELRTGNHMYPIGIGPTETHKLARPCPTLAVLHLNNHVQSEQNRFHAAEKQSDFLQICFQAEVFGVAAARVVSKNLRAQAKRFISIHESHPDR